jgi:type IV secretion system protein VirB10
MLLVGGLSTVLVALLIFWKTPAPKSKDDGETATNNRMGAMISYVPPKAESMPIVAAAARLPAPPAPPPVVAQAQPTPSLPQITNLKKDVRPGFVAFNVPAIPDGLKPKAAPESEPERDLTRVVYKGSTLPGTKAGPLGDSALLLKPGLLRCTLITAINSDLPGPFQCVLPGDVMSDQNVVLMEKGTTITGSYDSKITQGQKRLLALTAIAYTPNNCAVPLGGPMADGLGKTGLEGSVDNHVFERFGFAFILSMLDLGSNILQSELSKGGNTYLSFNSGGSGGVTSLAQEISQQSINIKPTIEVPQGSDVAVWLPGPAPISFEDCYRLVPRH